MPNESNRECGNCMLRASGTCTSLSNTPCSDFRAKPTITSEERSAWPAYGDATAFALGEKRRYNTVTPLSAPKKSKVQPEKSGSQHSAHAEAHERPSVTHSGRPASATVFHVIDYIIRGNACLKMDWLPAARDYYEKALPQASCKEWQVIFSNLAKCYIKLEEPEKIISQLSLFSRKYGKSHVTPEMLFAAAKAYLAQDDSEHASQCLSRAEIHPDLSYAEEKDLEILKLFIK